MCVFIASFFLQFNNQEIFPASDMSHYLTKLKFHLDAYVNIRLRISLDFNELPTIHIESKNWS